MEKWLKKVTRAVKESNAARIQVVDSVLLFIKICSQTMLSTISCCFGWLGLVTFGIVGGKEELFAMSADELYQTQATLCSLAAILILSASAFKNMKSPLALVSSFTGAVASIFICPILVAQIRLNSLQEILTNPAIIPLYITCFSQIALSLLEQFGPTKVWVELPGGLMKQISGKTRAEALAKAKEFGDKYRDKA